MFNSSIKNVIVLLCVTIIPVFLPYTYLYLTDIDRVNVQLQSTCINISKNDKLSSTEDLCLSCFYRDDARVPAQFKIQVKQISSGVYKNNRLNQMKKIITIQKIPQKQQQQLELESILPCKDIIQMIDYEKLQKAKKLADQERISQAQFQLDVQPIRELLAILNMRLSDQTSSESVLVGRQMKVFGVLQIVRRGQNDLKGNLVQVQYPNLQQIQILTNYLFLLTYTAILFCLGMLAYKLITTKTIIFQIFTNITVLCGLLASFQYYGLSSNNYFYFLAMLLYACITFLKLEMGKISVFLFGSASMLLFTIAMMSKAMQLVVAFKVIFCIVAIILIFMHSYNSFEHRPYFIYLWGVWNILTILQVQYDMYDNFRALFARNALIIVSVALMEVVGRVKLVFFGQDGTSFTKIEQMEEQMMEQQEQQQPK